MRIAAAGACVALAAIALTGCKGTEQYKDAPGSGVTNRQPADTVEMPDGFSNLATKCDHGNRVYVIFHHDSGYGAVAVVPHDPSCG